MSRESMKKKILQPVKVDWHGGKNSWEYENLKCQKLSAQDQLGELKKFKRQFHCYNNRNGQCGDQIFNADETGLNFSMLAKKTLVSQLERSAPGYKILKERVTVFACSIVTGTHIQRLAVIGESQNSGAFEKIEQKNPLPLTVGIQIKKVHGWIRRFFLRSFILCLYHVSVNFWKDKICLERRCFSWIMHLLIHVIKLKKLIDLF